MLLRYCGAIYRYLVRVVKDANVADELAQEFALRFVQGKFQNVDPSRGRFRDYIKTCLFNLIREHFRKAARNPQELLQDASAGPEVIELEEADFVEGWRDETLTKTWDALAKHEKESGQVYHTVLDYRTQHPDLTSAQLAEALTKQLGRPLTPSGVRQLVHRARERFANLLIDEVASSVQSQNIDDVADELGELGLLPYCKDVLEQRRGSSG